MPNMVAHVTHSSGGSKPNGFGSTGHRLNGIRCGARRAVWLILVIIATSFLGRSSTAQAITGDIVGTVNDAGGAVIPGAKVTVLNSETQFQRSMATTSTGDYVFPLLPPGTYTVRVEQTGFKTFEARGITIAAGGKTRVDAKLDPGAVSETVTVTSDTPLLQTDTSTVQDVVTEKAVQDLPLNGRNLAAAVQQAAGVNQASPNSEAQGNRADDRRPGFAYAANGQSDLSNNSLVDGLGALSRRRRLLALFRPPLQT